MVVRELERNMLLGKSSSRIYTANPTCLGRRFRGLKLGSLCRVRCLDLLSRIRLFTTLLVCFVLHGAVVSPMSYGVEDAGKRVQFARDIQPILAKHCLVCHGLDQSEGGVQFHLAETAFAPADSGEYAIVPGKSDESELIHRIVSRESDLQMPPEGDRLSKAEVQMLEQWIDSGASWDVHWAYSPIVSGDPPEVDDAEWPKVDLDRFVLSRLEQRQIRPSAIARPETLIKRLHYDLIGLPPSPTDVAAFVANHSPAAYEELVERLLSSEHFGERWGRHWLDKARYADSDGYEKDNHRPDAWKYRDWVIKAINEDLPFDQFTIQQLAGDMLPEAASDQMLATAFHRQTLTNTEGGTDREQWRVAAVMDRTETLGTVWLGLSVGCARCHSHKYDRITHQEYYQLFAYFNNGDEVNVEIPKDPIVYETLEGRLRSLELQLKQQQEGLAGSKDEWFPRMKRRVTDELETEIKEHSLNVIRITGPEGVEFKLLEDGSYLAQGANPESAKYTIECEVDVDQVSGIHLEVLPHESLKHNGPGRTEHGNFVLNDVRVYASDHPEWNLDAKQEFASASADFSQDGWPVLGAIDGVEGKGKQGTGWAISPKFGVKHSAWFSFEKPIAQGKRFLQIVLSQSYGTQHTIGRFRLQALTGQMKGKAIPAEIRQIILEERNDNDALQTLIAYQATLDPECKKLEAEIRKLRSQLEQEVMTVRVIRERTSDLRPTHVFRRGEFKQPQEQVNAGTLATLPEIISRDGKAETDRLDLANWLVNGDNPLVPRVAVNHVWYHLFGAGIVPTMNDFGVRGDPPSHPKLLDHLAGKFINKGWSRKQLIKYIVMSSTYQQASVHRPELVEVDPRNRLLHRQNRFRVEAEIIRDISLAVSGLLSNKVGGPSVFPPIPPSVTDLTYNSSFKWKVSTGEDRYRRGLYTYFKRTAPHPNLITFDCPDSNVANVQRDRSNTPIGALVTLNNATFVEAAQAMAARILKDDSLEDDRQRIQQAMSLCVARIPSDGEVDDFQRLLGVSRAWYSEHQEDAKEFVGGYAVDSVDDAENAAWVATVRMILNLDEFLTRE